MQGNSPDSMMGMLTEKTPICIRTCSIIVYLPMTVMTTDHLAAVLIPAIRTSPLILREIKKKEAPLVLQKKRSVTIWPLEAWDVPSPWKPVLSLVESPAVAVLALTYISQQQHQWVNARNVPGVKEKEGLENTTATLAQNQNTKAPHHHLHHNTQNIEYLHYQVQWNTTVIQKKIIKHLLHHQHLIMESSQSHQTKSMEKIKSRFKSLLSVCVETGQSTSAVLVNVITTTAKQRYLNGKSLKTGTVKCVGHQITDPKMDGQECFLNRTQTNSLQMAELLDIPVLVSTHPLNMLVDIVTTAEIIHQSLNMRRTHHLTHMLISETIGSLETFSTCPGTTVETVVGETTGKYTKQVWIGLDLEIPHPATLTFNTITKRYLKGLVPHPVVTMVCQTCNIWITNVHITKDIIHHLMWITKGVMKQLEGGGQIVKVLKDIMILGKGQ
ncbi:unnamed protein product [Lymnaea stagnalis]|uniref:Uncharacterized protein n=1 Tax=Lymnaea stagnalis TaxID=6523 RepID=A0AAV2H960_LYMST